MKWVKNLLFTQANSLSLWLSSPFRMCTLFRYSDSPSCFSSFHMNIHIFFSLFYFTIVYGVYTWCPSSTDDGQNREIFSLCESSGYMKQADGKRAEGGEEMCFFLIWAVSSHISKWNEMRKISQSMIKTTTEWIENGVGLFCKPARRLEFLRWSLLLKIVYVYMLDNSDEII